MSPACVVLIPRHWIAAAAAAVYCLLLDLPRPAVVGVAGGVLSCFSFVLYNSTSTFKLMKIVVVLNNNTIQSSCKVMMMVE